MNGGVKIKVINGQQPGLTTNSQQFMRWVNVVICVVYVSWDILLFKPVINLYMQGTKPCKKAVYLIEI